MRLVGWSLTSLFSTNMAISETNCRWGMLNLESDWCHLADDVTALATNASCEAMTWCQTTSADGSTMLKQLAHLLCARYTYCTCTENIPSDQNPDYPKILTLHTTERAYLNCHLQTCNCTQLEVTASPLFHLFIRNVFAKYSVYQAAPAI